MTSNQHKSAPSIQNLDDIIAHLVASTQGKKPGSIKPEDPLLSSQAGFDSFSLMELVLRLEDSFGLSIPDEDLDPDVFHSVKTIASYMHMRLQKRD
jgi:acyl carrier protein